MNGIPDFDLAKAQKDKDEAEAYNRQLALTGAIGDNLGSRQSFGNFFLGKMNPESTMGRTLASNLKMDVKDPAERYKDLLTNYRMKMGAEKDTLDNKKDNENNEKGGAKYLEMKRSIETAYPGIKLPENGSVNDLNEQLPILSKPILQKMEQDNWLSKNKALKSFEYGLDVKKLGEKQALEMRDPAKQFEHLPKEIQIQITKIADSSGAILPIKNEIDSAYGQLTNKNLSDGQKLLVGRNLLKTLNSTQGKDAVGAEEAKRLGSLLEYKLLPRIGEPGNTFGRDLDEFVNQVALSSQKIGETHKANQLAINKLKNGMNPNDFKAEIINKNNNQNSMINNANAAPNTPSSEDMDALHWATKNSNDPRAAGILNNLKNRGLIK